MGLKGRSRILHPVLPVPEIQHAVAAHAEGVNRIIAGGQPVFPEYPHDIGGHEVTGIQMVFRAVIGQQNDGGFVQNPLIVKALH